MANTSNDPWSSEAYSTNANFVPILGNVILDMLAPQSHERILDLGCGDGALTKKLEALCGHVTGVDASPDMIRTAIEKESLTDVHVVDGHDLGEWFEKEKLEPYDAVFSNAAMHWMKRDPTKVITGVKKCLKPNGRFVSEMGGYLNISDIHGSLIAALNRRGYDGVAISPWFFPSPKYYKGLLEQNGFKVQQISLVPRPTELPTDLNGWLDTFGFQFFAPLKNDEEREAVKAEVIEHMKPTNMREDGVWEIMYVRLRFVAILEK